MLIISNVIDNVIHVYIHIAAFLIVAMLVEHTVRFHAAPTFPVAPVIPARPTGTATDIENPASVKVPTDKVPTDTVTERAAAPVADSRPLAKGAPPAIETAMEERGRAIELPKTLKGLQAAVRERGLIDRVKNELGKSYLRCRKAELATVLAT